METMISNNNNNNNTNDDDYFSEVTEQDMRIVEKEAGGINSSDFTEEEYETEFDLPKFEEPISVIAQEGYTDFHQNDNQIEYAELEKVPQGMEPWPQEHQMPLSPNFCISYQNLTLSNNMPQQHSEIGMDIEIKDEFESKYTSPAPISSSYDLRPNQNNERKKRRMSELSEKKYDPIQKPCRKRATKKEREGMTDEEKVFKKMEDNRKNARVCAEKKKEHDKEWQMHKDCVTDKIKELEESKNTILEIFRSENYVDINNDSVTGGYSEYADKINNYLHFENNEKQNMTDSINCDPEMLEIKKDIKDLEMEIATVEHKQEILKARKKGNNENQEVVNEPPSTLGSQKCRAKKAKISKELEYAVLELNRIYDYIYAIVKHLYNGINNDGNSIVNTLRRGNMSWELSPEEINYLDRVESLLDAG